MAESGASASPSIALEKTVVPVGMAESGGSPSSCSPLEKNEMTPDRSPSEAMDTDVNVAAMDYSPAVKTLKKEPNDVAAVKSLRDVASMGAKGMSVDENQRSEAETPSQSPAPVRLPCRDLLTIGGEVLAGEGAADLLHPLEDPLASKKLKESRAELLDRVQALKKDLENWRGRLDTQVKSYREELGDLRTSLNSEVEQLRTEFQDLRNTLKQQRDLTSTKLAKLDEPSKTTTNPELPLPTA